jgi:hypothetical protein
MTYAIWETESGNIIGDFGSEVAALRAVLDAAELNGAASIESFALVGYGHGKPKGIAAGADLLRLARQRGQTAPT